MAAAQGSEERRAMDVDAIERALVACVPSADREPRRLHRAIVDAVRGGKRRRALLALEVAMACGGDAARAMPVALGVELLHAASLVHDDLPCFDDAATRRGRPSIHAAYGEPAAVLVGDALLAKAFEVSAGAEHHGARLVALLAQAVGTERGLIGGQALELEPSAELSRYHDAKTAALYRYAARGGALGAGDADPRWSELGTKIGLLAQLADDLLDVQGDARAAGKPVGVDAALGRPNAVLVLGLEGSRARSLALREELARVAASLGAPGKRVLGFVLEEASRI